MAHVSLAKGRILFAAHFQVREYQAAMENALQSFGWEVEGFHYGDYAPRSPGGKLQNRYLLGASVKKLNKDLIERCSCLKPDVIFIHRGVHVWPQTIVQLKQYTRLIVSWATEDPFGDYDLDFAKKYTTKTNIWSVFLSRALAYERALYFKILWSNVIRTITLYDIWFVFQAQSLRNFHDMGAKEVHLLRAGYIPTLHRPVGLTVEEQHKYGSDVVFIGHFEPDHRVECLEALLEAGIHVRLYGTGWDRYLSRTLREAFGPSIRPLYGEEYVKALCAGRIALCFFSKLNRDAYTTRSFEIPACGSLLMSERTDEMKELFEEDKEAVYFSDKEELVQKVQWLLKDPEQRNAIAIAGHGRCLRDGNDVASRMRDWSDVVSRHLDSQ